MLNREFQLLNDVYKNYVNMTDYYGEKYVWKFVP